MEDSKKKKNSRTGNRGAFSECVFLACVVHVCVCVCGRVCMFWDKTRNQSLRFLRVCVPGTCRSFTSCPSSLNNWSQSVRAKPEPLTEDRVRGLRFIQLNRFFFSWKPRNERCCLWRISWINLNFLGISKKKSVPVYVRADGCGFKTSQKMQI